MSEEEQKQLELEMLYSTYDMSCLNPALVAAPDNALESRECRRPKGHPGYHASGFGTRLVRW